MLHKCDAYDSLFPGCKLCSEKSFVFMYSSGSTQGKIYLDRMYGKDLVFYFNICLLIWYWSKYKPLWFSVIFTNFKCYFSLICGIMQLVMSFGYFNLIYLSVCVSFFFLLLEILNFFKRNIICLICLTSYYQKKRKNSKWFVQMISVRVQIFKL